MVSPLSPITEKVYHALIRMNVSFDTMDQGKLKYTNGVLSIFDDDNIKVQEMSSAENSFETYNLAYEENFLGFVKDIYELNQDNVVLVNAKINELDNPTLLRILTMLDYRDKLLCVDLIKNSATGLYIARDERLLTLLTKLATRNLSYCTFHFLSKPITLCCCPNLTFQAYTTDFSSMDTYIEIARKNHLYLNELQVKY